VRRRQWRAAAAGIAAVAVGLLLVVPPAFGRDELARQQAILRFNLATAGLRSAEPLVDRALAAVQAGPRSGGGPEARGGESDRAGWEGGGRGDSAEGGPGTPTAGEAETEEGRGAAHGGAAAEREGRQPAEAPSSDDLARAAELLRGAIGELDRALVEHPGFAAARITRGVARHRLGNLRLLAGDPERALREYLVAREDLIQGARLALAAGDRVLAGRAREVAVAVERNLARAETAISGR
jgi:hypothetical protein